MKDEDFFNGLRDTDREKEDFVHGAEHFIRLKTAYQIDPSDRPDIPKKDFAQPGKEEAGHTGKYPIPDRQHARSALGFAKMHHDSGALAAVRAKVEQKYPDMLGHEKDSCLSCGQEKTACMCKSASALDSARAAMAKNPMLRSAVIGGLVSGGIGAGSAAMDAPPGYAIPDAIRAGVKGGAVGAAGGALYHHLSTKLAEEREKTANAIVDAIKHIDPAIAIPTAAGGVAGALLTRHGSKPRHELGGRSKAEHELEAQVDTNSRLPENGLLHKMHNRNTELQHGYAKAFREHPNKATMVGALSGALGGYGIGRLGGAVLKMRGGK